MKEQVGHGQEVNSPVIESQVGHAAKSVYYDGQARDEVAGELLVEVKTAAVPDAAEIPGGLHFCLFIYSFTSRNRKAGGSHVFPLTF